MSNESLKNNCAWVSNMYDETMKRFETTFEQVKKELKFKATLEELDSIFFIRDYIIHENFVNQTLSRAIARRIVDLLMSWYGYLHGLLMPNPSSMASIGESNFLNDDEKSEIMSVMNKIMAYASTNSLIGLTKNKAEEGKFIDNSVAFWTETLNPFLTKIMKNVNEGWKNKGVPSQKKQTDRTFG